MKLYLSSYRIPTPDDLATLLGKPLSEVRVALIPNAKDYYSRLAWNYKANEMVAYLQQLGMAVTIVDLRQYDNPDALRTALEGHDLIWARGGNTYVLRYEMHRSGFDQVIGGLLEQGVVYGGDSAGALVAGLSIAGVELSDNPAFAEAVVNDGMQLVPCVILPHVDNPEFSGDVDTFRETHADKDIIELKDSQAVIFDGDAPIRIVTAEDYLIGE